MTNAYIIYRGDKIYVTVDSYFSGINGRQMANVTAIEGYPFLSSDGQAQGETSGLNSNGYRIRTDFIYIEKHPVVEAYMLDKAMKPEFEDDWCYPVYISGGEVIEGTPYRPAKPVTEEEDFPF